MQILSLSLLNIVTLVQDNSELAKEIGLGVVMATILIAFLIRGGRIDRKQRDEWAMIEADSKKSTADAVRSFQEALDIDSTETFLN